MPIESTAPRPPNQPDGVCVPARVPACVRASARGLRRLGVSVALAASLATGGAPAAAHAQEPTAVPGPVLSSFASMRVAIFPVQLWRADTTAWSGKVDWAVTRLALDTAVTTELLARGLAKRWAYSSDAVRSAKRNPTYASDPYALGVARWRAEAPKPTDPIPTAVADNLRPLTALGDTRYALIPVELRAAGEFAVLRLVLADARLRRVVWVGEVAAPAGDGMIEALASRVADLVIEP